MSTDFYDTNRVRLVGTLDTQRVRRAEATLAERWNDVRGRERRAMLQVCSPFGKPFQVVLRLDAVAEGLALLAETPAGAALAVEGDLAWMQTTDPRYAVRIEDRGRQTSEIIVRARRIQPAAADEEPGCDIRLAGTVLTAPRLLRHPDRPIDVVVTTIRVEVTHTRPGSRARITEPSNIAVAIAADHADAPNLLCPNNHVIIEGMLERHLVPLRDPATVRAVAALDADWREQQQRVAVGQVISGELERRYLRRRRQLQEESRLRVVAGYVELRAGRALTIEEGQALRASLVARSREERSARSGRRRSVVEVDAAEVEDAAQGDEDSTSGAAAGNEGAP